MKKIILKNKIQNKDHVVYLGSFVKNAIELSQYDIFTVNLTAEYPDLPSSINVPIKDFSIPKDHVNDKFNDALNLILEEFSNDRGVFFGCLGGIGRTGIMLGCLLKILGTENAGIVYQTRQYLPHALETEEQIEFVKNFNPNLHQKYMKYLSVDKLLKNEKDDLLILKKIIPIIENKKYDNGVIIEKLLANKKDRILKSLTISKLIKTNELFNGQTLQEMALAKKNKNLELFFKEYENQKQLTKKKR